MNSIDTVELIQRVVTTLAAGTGGVVAILGLRTWRRQLRGKTEYELARRLLRASLRVRDELAYVRGALIMAGEIAAAVDETGADFPVDDPRAAELARARRWKHLSSALSDLEAEALEGEVIWGKEIQACLEILRQQVRELRGASWEYGFLQNAERPLQPDERQRLVELRRLVFGTGGNNDGFAAEVERAVFQIEARLRPHLKI